MQPPSPVPPDPSRRAFAPLAILRTSGEGVAGEVVAYCWERERSAPDCWEASGFVDSEAEAGLNRRESVKVEFRTGEAPTEAVRLDFTQPTYWVEPSTRELHSGNPIVMEVDLAPGRHWLALRTVWDEGWVTYMFKVMVRSD